MAWITAIQRPLEVGPTRFPELAFNFSMAVVETRSCKFCTGRERLIRYWIFFFFLFRRFLEYALQQGKLLSRKISGSTAGVKMLSQKSTSWVFLHGILNS